MSRRVRPERQLAQPRYNLAADAPLISVIITNYNYEAFVGDAIRSVLEQSYPKVECIVVDDGSTDGSRTVIARYERTRTVFQSNTGQCGAARAGLALASGDIVLFLDSDDFLFPDAAASVARAWKPGISAVLFRLRISRNGVADDATLPHQPFVDYDAKSFVRNYGYLPAAPASGNAYAASVARKIFANSLHLDDRNYGFDTWLILCSPFLGPIVIIDRPLGVYRIHGANASLSARVTLKRVQALFYYQYWAQQSAERFNCSHLGWHGHGRLKGPYPLKWYILTRSHRGEFVIPDHSKVTVIWKCCWEFLTFPAIPLRKRLLNCLIVLGYAPLPGWIKQWVLKNVYGFTPTEP